MGFKGEKDVLHLYDSALLNSSQVLRKDQHDNYYALFHNNLKFYLMKEKICEFESGFGGKEV